MRQRLGLARCGPPRRPRPLLWWLQRYFHVGRGTPRMAVPPRPSGEPPPPTHTLRPVLQPCRNLAVQCPQLSPAASPPSARSTQLLLPHYSPVGPGGGLTLFGLLTSKQRQATGQGAPPCPASPHYSALRLQLRPTLTRPQCHQGGLKGSICPSFH